MQLSVELGVSADSERHKVFLSFVFLFQNVKWLVLHFTKSVLALKVEFMKTASLQIFLLVPGRVRHTILKIEHVQ